MPERPPEFSDIDLDEEDEEEQPKPQSDEEPLDPIDVDDAEDDDVDVDPEDDEDDVEADVDGGTPRASVASVASPEPLDDEEAEADLAIARNDGIQRAAAVLKYIVENIVDEPDQISIGATTDDRGPVLLLSVAEADRGKVIGRQGRIVQAIRTVVKAATVGTGERVSVEIID